MSIDQTREIAPYAANPRSSRGRLHPEQASPTRSPYGRDRDRILHATAFRRLNYKTQVFVYHEGDHYRSRLTHSLEVAQIARAIARTLHLDEDLTEALALAHDLGHPPFGHAGERALDAAMTGRGGFDHNAQSLRVVTELEKKYASFDGLNLTFETLEGLVKHNGPLLGRDDAKPIPEPILAYCAKQDLELQTYPSVEAQVAALADDIAYNNHDVDDGYRAGLFTFAELAEVPIAGRLLAEVRAAHPGIDCTRLLYESNRRLITAMIDDVTAETGRRLAALDPERRRRAAGQACGRCLLAADAARARCAPRLSAYARVYRNPRIVRIMGGPSGVVARSVRSLQRAIPRRCRPNGATRRLHPARALMPATSADFIAGMTDRYALAEHRRLFDATPDLR